MISIVHSSDVISQAKVRLEMNLEKSRQQHIKEIEEKEQEMEELRYSTQKKVITCSIFDVLQDDKILVLSKLNAFADNNFIVA